MLTSPASFEVVTASGTVIIASPTIHTDLYWALRGGGNNFGIVTRFNLETIPQGLIWGGTRLHAGPQFPALLDAFYNLGVNSTQDPAAAQVLSFVYINNARFASSLLQYARPVADAAIFEEYMSIPTIEDDTTIRTLANQTLQLNLSNPHGLREIYWGATFKLDRNYLAFAAELLFEEVVDIADAEGLVPALSLQVITIPQLRNMAKHGGNALGLDEGCGALLILHTSIMWADQSDDGRILKTAKTIIDRAVVEGKERGLWVEFVYMNYASQFQEVVPGYGAKNHARLKDIARKYDPKGVFQQLQPGHFKLDGAPSPWVL